jgi:hypothetical protein
VCSAKNGIVNIGEEGISGKETTDYISDISRYNCSRREGGAEEIMYMCGVVWIENIGIGLERGIEV